MRLQLKTLIYTSLSINYNIRQQRTQVKDVNRNGRGGIQKSTLNFSLFFISRYLHNKSIVHGDIKPLNVFISKELVAKLGDFGMAHYLEEEDCFGGTFNYFAPEMLRIQDEKHSKKTDVWAIGCTSYYIYTGKNLFEENTNDSTPQVCCGFLSSVTDYSTVSTRLHPDSSSRNHIFSF